MASFAAFRISPRDGWVGSTGFYGSWEMPDKSPEKRLPMKFAVAGSALTSLKALFGFARSSFAKGFEPPSFRN